MNHRKLCSTYGIIVLFVLMAVTCGQHTVSASFGAIHAQAGRDESGNQVAVVELLEKHIAATGGRDAWKAVRTVETHSESEVFENINKTYRLEERTTKRFYQSRVLPIKRLILAASSLKP